MNNTLKAESMNFYANILHYDEDGNTPPQNISYCFSSMEQLQQYVNGEYAVDKYGETQLKGYYDIPQRVYAQIDYEI